MTSFKPRLGVLSKPQRNLWPELSQVPDQFTLYGGLAIALQLGHRESFDFDFFSTRSFTEATLRGTVSFLATSPVETREPAARQHGDSKTCRPAEVQIIFGLRSALHRGGLGCGEIVQGRDAQTIVLADPRRPKL